MNQVADEPTTGALDNAAPRVKRGWTMGQIYLLAMLFLVNLFNYMDRGILSILQEPIKDEFGLKDWQLGLITGPAFAILYSTAGIPAARIAERFNRVTVLSVALLLWSGMTAMCGAATNFVQMFLARLGVGAGEGACTPVTHSLISDTFPPNRRGIVLALLTTSTPLSQLITPILGGYVAMTYGWRAAFLIVGIPGILLAIAFKLTIRDPRENAESTLVNRKPAGKFLEDIKILFGDKAFKWLFVSNIFLGMAVTSTNAFTASYFVRQYDLTLVQVGMVIAVGLGLAGVAGTFIGGFFADKFAGRYGRSYPLVCSVAAGGAGLLFFATFMNNNWQIAAVLLILANVFNDLKNGPNYASIQNIAPSNMRATATAVTLAGAIVVGGSIGPFSIGLLSDIIGGYYFPPHLGDFATVCQGSASMKGKTELLNACSSASASGLRGGLMVAILAYFIAMPGYLRTAFSISRPLD